LRETGKVVDLKSLQSSHAFSEPDGSLVTFFRTKKLQKKIRKLRCQDIL